MKRLKGGIDWLFENSMFLIGGAAVALLWANLGHHSYDQIVHHKGFTGFDEPANLFHFVVNDVAMAFFFLLAGKEIRESMLPGGALSSAKTAALPIMATAGGMAGPALVYLGGVFLFDKAILAQGWAIPMATDIAFSYLIARMIFPKINGKLHPAIIFLLLLAIADDAGGLIVLAVFYGQEPLVSFGNLVGIGLLAKHPILVLFPFVGLAIGTAMIFWKVFKVRSFWPYILVSGSLSWLGFFFGGIHPALALVPLAWCMPHEHSDLGFWTPGESERKDTLNQMEHWWKRPVELILGLFGFANAGVAFGAVGVGTGLVFCGLLFGKPLGIVLFTKLGELFGLKKPEGMTNRDLVIVGVTAGIGFTVALFVSVVAFKADTEEMKIILDSVKMGALLSFFVAPIALILAKILRGKLALGKEK
jgi:NhaA family Na+:H+ antiporter